MLGGGAWIYNLAGWIYRVRANRDDGKPDRKGSRSASPGEARVRRCAPPQLHVIVCTVYEIGIAIPVIETEYVLFGCVVQPIGRKLIAYFDP
jgi:hypothetical protein